MVQTKIIVTGSYQDFAFPLHLDGEGLATLKQVKKNIQEETGMQMKSQLLLQCDGNHCYYLPDDVFIESFSPRLNLSLYAKMKNPEEKIELSVITEDSTPAYRAGTDFSLRIMLNATVGRLRELMDERTGVPPGRQMLIVNLGKRNSLGIGPEQLGTVLLSEIMPQGMKNLVLKNLPMNPATSDSLTVMVPTEKEELKLTVEHGRHTINSVKCEVLTMLRPGVAKKKLRLKRNNGDYLSDGTMTLEQCQIFPGEILHFVS